MRRYPAVDIGDHLFLAKVIQQVVIVTLVKF